MLGDGHVRFGGRAREPGRPKCRNRALVRPYTSIQARVRRHATVAGNGRHKMLVEHEYERGGARQYLAAWDVRRAKLFGRCEAHTGIGPFGRLAEQVMSSEPYRGARRVFWVVDNGPSHRGEQTEVRLRERWPQIRVVHTPIHASWLNQIEIYFGILERKGLTPPDAASLEALAATLLAFGARSSAIATPFEWRFTRLDLHRVLNALPTQVQAQAA